MTDWGEEREGREGRMAPPRTLRDIRVNEYAENQRDFAQRIGVNAATLSMWETGRNSPQFRLRHQVAEALSLRVTQIIWEAPRDAASQVRRAIQQTQRKRTTSGVGRSRPQLSLG